MTSSWIGSFLVKFSRDLIKLSGHISSWKLQQYLTSWSEEQPKVWSRGKKNPPYVYAVQEKREVIHFCISSSELRLHFSPNFLGMFFFFHFLGHQNIFLFPSLLNSKFYLSSKLTEKMNNTVHTSDFITFSKQMATFTLILNNKIWNSNLC